MGSVLVHQTNASPRTIPIASMQQPNNGELIVTYSFVCLYSYLTLILSLFLPPPDRQAPIVDVLPPDTQDPITGVPPPDTHDPITGVLPLDTQAPIMGVPPPDTQTPIPGVLPPDTQAPIADVPQPSK